MPNWLTGAQVALQTIWPETDHQTKGAVIISITPGSPAARQDLKVGDVVCVKEQTSTDRDRDGFRLMTESETEALAISSLPCWRKSVLQMLRRIKRQEAIQPPLKLEALCIKRRQPNRGKRSDVEQIHFKRQLKNSNLLYLGAYVLVLLDLSYQGRFW